MWMSAFYLVVVVVVVVVIVALIAIVVVVSAVVAASVLLQEASPARKRRLAESAGLLWFPLRPLPLNVSRLISGEDSLLRGDQYVIIRRHLYRPPPRVSRGPVGLSPLATLAFLFFLRVCVFVIPVCRAAAPVS